MQTQALLKGVNLYLIGMMGSGKSTVGKAIAQQLGYRFFDTDTVITQVAGKSIVEIFAEQGEIAFRQLETKVLAELSAYTRLAIATGGGIVIERMNWSYLRHGIVVWLDVPVADLYERLKQDTSRPLLREVDPLATLTRILDQRHHLYEQADLRVTLTQQETPNQAAARILEELPAILRTEWPQPPEVPSVPPTPEFN